MISLFRRSLIIVVCLLSVACTSTNQNSSLMGGLLLSEPEQLNPRSQLAIAHFTNSLYQVKMSKSERAQLLFQRGLAYDSVGLTSLARMDYSEALQLNPSFAPAHNRIGVHYIQAGMYTLAYESFDSSLEIDPNYEYAVLNRGIALYYGGRKQLASADTQRYLGFDKSDPIRWLWHYIASSSIEDEAEKQAALQNLEIAREELSSENWTTSIADFYLGKVTESEVIKSLVADVDNSSQLNYRLCEAYFYLGKYYVQQGNLTKAENYFKLSLSTNVYEYVEHKFARIELDNVRRTRYQNSLSKQ